MVSTMNPLKKPPCFEMHALAYLRLSGMQTRKPGRAVAQLHFRGWINHLPHHLPSHARTLEACAIEMHRLTSACAFRPVFRENNAGEQAPEDPAKYPKYPKGGLGFSPQFGLSSGDDRNSYSCSQNRCAILANRSALRMPSVLGVLTCGENSRRAFLRSQKKWKTQVCSMC